MTRPDVASPYVADAALTEGLAAHVVDRLLARYLPPLLMAMDDEQRAELEAYRAAVRRAADAYEHRPVMSANGPTDIPETDLPAGSEWISAGQAAALLGITPRHARRLATVRGLGGKVGGRWVLDRSLVIDYRNRERRSA